jgi:PKD repeat protein
MKKILRYKKSGTFGMIILFLLFNVLIISDVNAISKDNPIAEIVSVNPNPGYSDQQITMSGRGMDVENCDLYFSWDFNDDGNWEIYKELVPGGCGGGWLYHYTSFIYTSPGTYYITLVVEDNFNNINKDTITIQILNNPPEVSFTFFPINPTTQDEIQFIDNSMPGCYTTLTWDWDFGDGYNANIQNPTHQYIDDGTYLVTLVVVDCQEGPGSASRYVVVSNTPPNANIISISPNPANENDEITFNGFGEDLDGIIENYYWESNIDGFLSNEISFNTISLSEGIHEISFKVQDDDGDWSEIVTQNLDINNILNLPPTIPTIQGETSGEKDNIYEYKIKSTDPEQDDITYCIDWGDGTPEVCFGPFSSGEEIKVNNSWKDEGEYVIRVKARDTNGGESDWGILKITMPKHKFVNLDLFKSHNSYSILFQLIQKILRLYQF